MRLSTSLSIVIILACAAAPALGAPLLLQTPTLSKTSIAFAYGDEIWTVDRNGGDAHVLVGTRGRASGPLFSPDGSRVAYTANVSGNNDMFVVAAAGGEPQRLTWHPGPNVAVGWTPDGKGVLFHSRRESSNDSSRLFVMPVGGGMPQALPLDMAETGAYSPDGLRLAYSPAFQWEPDWRNYRGGQTPYIWIAQLSDSSVVPVPRDNSNDTNPMWIGGTVYFLSDRNGPTTLFGYDVASGKVAQLVENNNGFPIDAASAGPDAIVYSQMGVVHIFDLAKQHEHVVPIHVAGDLERLQPHYEKVAKEIEHAGLSPSGVRAVFEAHGEILTVPAEKGDVRNLTRTPGIAERDPAWAPDGKSVAYFSDASGEYALAIRSQDGLGNERRIALGSPPSFFYTPTWSPDSRRIAYSDKRLNLWYVDLEHPTPIKIDTDRYDSPLHEFDAAWSPDGRWIAYTKQLPNQLRAVFVYSLASGKSVQVTDGLSDCLYPNFDANGKYLYFTASTDVGLSSGWLDMSSEAHPITRSVYVAVLRKDLPSPLAPESDEDKGTAKADEDGAAAGKKAADKKSKQGEPQVAIDFAGILQRTLALPIPPANYVGLRAGKSGELFLLEGQQVATAPDEPDKAPPYKIQKFDLGKRKLDKLADEASDFALSFDGNKMLYREKDSWFIAKTTDAPKPGEGKLATHDMEVQVDPRQEWAQMYHEVWRIERDFFYDPHYHGLDIAAAEKHFQPFVAGIASRSDLNFLFKKMLAYMSVGHMFIEGGTEPEIDRIQVGLLGADYRAENGRYRFAKIYNGENWNPELHAPLTQPGVDVKAGDYLLAVNGHELHDGENLYRLFQETVDKQTVLRVGASADGKGSRLVTVLPIKTESGLRHLDWLESNRRKVDQLSGGKLAYVHLPDTAEGGFTSFNRYYFAQVGKQGAVIDERYNHGGQLADYIVDSLQRPLMSGGVGREGEDMKSPAAAIYGPKGMLINQFSGSGGDALPWYFKRKQIGMLIGTRTWGGLVGIGGYPPLLDGGSVTAPRWALYGLNGAWEVENHGVAPDIEVVQDPKLVREGHDPQLERAVAYLMQQLAEHPQPELVRPPYPDFHPVLPPLPVDPSPANPGKP